MKKISKLFFVCFLFFFTFGAHAKQYHIGVSLLTQQHPFYISLADAIKQKAQQENVDLSLSIASQDQLNAPNYFHESLLNIFIYVKMIKT